MKRLLILVGVFLGLADSAIAQKPSCMTTPTSSHPNFWSYHFGDYTSSAGSCSLQSGQGVELQFDITPGSGTGITSHFSIDIANSNRPPIESLTWTDSDPNVMYRMDRKTYEQSQPTLQKIPNWVTQIIDQNQDIFRRRIPKGYAAWEKVFAEQKIIDASTFRDSLNAMNAGQLFAKADELSSSGDSAKAREVLRALVSRFPDHPLAAQAASQMAGMSSNQTNNANNGNGANAGSNNGAASNGSVPAVGGGKCWDVMAKREKEYEAINRRPTPAGATPPFMRVMWMTADSIKIIDTYCAGDAKAAKYRSELQLAYNQSKTACEQLSAGQCQPNPY